MRPLVLVGALEPLEQHQVLPSCEMIQIQDINQAFTRMHNNDVKYRFVIDMASLTDVETL